MKNWISRKESERIELLEVVAQETNLPDYMVEKDWWVTTMLEAIFSSKLKEHFAFKGGTSLSKSWNILKRFSEDIDIVIDKGLFGVSDNDKPGRMDRERLRDAAHKYIGETVYPILAERLSMMEIPIAGYQFYLDKSKSSDQDPTIILLDYNPVANIPRGYTLPQIRIEVGVRAMMEPTGERPISSLLSQTYNPGEQFGVRSVLPHRTFWEKAFLLHELFQKPIDKIDISRMSRHWYDLYSLNQAGFGKTAMVDKDLFEAIRGHRGVFTRVPGIDYGVLKANSFNLFPPDALQGDWNRDYDSMMESYIYQDAPTMQELVQGIETIVANLKALSF
jgi:hypothetical protein